MSLPFGTVEQAISDIQAGKFIVLLDSAKRENEADLIAAASKVTPQMINFMLTHARGAFIAVFLPEEQAEKLELPHMIDPSENRESQKTKFRVTCDTQHGSSGCSVVDRAQTVNLLGGVLKSYEGPLDEGTLVRELVEVDDLVRPGHVQPITSDPEGLAGRQGHTDSGVALMKAAGISPPVAVDMELLHPEGTMLTDDHLSAFIKTHNLTLISNQQVCEYYGIPYKF